MYYEINVSLNGVHYFATAERSFTTLSQVEIAYITIKNKFPETEGFQVTVTRWTKTGEKVGM